MYDVQAMEEAARKMILRELERAGDRERGPWRMVKAVVSRSWMLRELVELLLEFQDQPLRLLEPTVRHRLTEHCTTPGDGMERETSAEVDREVGLVMRVLGQLRQIASAQGLIASRPATPIMCG